MTGHPRRLCPDNKSDKKQKGSRYTAVYALSLSTERTIFIQIGPELRVPAVLNSGANQVSLIPRQVLDRLVKAGWDRMRLDKLAHPILIKLGDNTSTIRCVGDWLP